MAKQTKEKTSANQKASPVIVGLGASAGGLGALQQFFKHMPQDSGMVFVVIVHLSPEHESHLADLLQARTAMPVTQVTEVVAMAPNHIYVIPPNRNLSAIDTHLRLSELEQSRGKRAPVDHFFRTLANMHGERSVAVVLSGTGTDGSLGLRHIKEAGGLTVVQTPEEAEYDGMPQNAIATGLVDLVLPVREMPRRLIAYLRSAQHQQPSADEQGAPDSQELLHKILTRVQAHTGQPFNHYKRSTAMRR